MIRRAAIACGLAAHLTAASAAAQAPTFTSGVSVVRFDVLASDGRRPITGLEGTDFEVFDRGVPQTVDAVFGESEPLDILFAFDRSASTSGDTIARLRDSARAIVATLHPDDRAGLLAFNNRFQLVSPLGPPEGLSAALETLRPESGTALLDAASVSLGLTAASTRRTMILLFTDGADTLSWLPERVVLEQARSSDAVLYAVAMEARREAAANAADTDAQLRRLAEATGGRLLRADRPEQLRERFLDLMGEMRARYVLTYMPTNGDVPGWHDVRVRLRGRSGRISTRAGYVVPANPRANR
jgi:VWFA-related protein